MLTISRSDLVDIATKAMKDSGITQEQHIEMCETAHKMDKVLLGGWVNEKCGCLVGTAFRNELAPNGGSDEIRAKFGSPMVEVGNRFDWLVREHLDSEGCLNPWRGRKIVKVIDD